MTTAVTCIVFALCLVIGMPIAFVIGIQRCGRAAVPANLAPFAGSSPTHVPQALTTSYCSQSHFSCWQAKE